MPQPCVEDLDLGLGDTADRDDGRRPRTTAPGRRGGTQSADRGARTWPLPSDPLLGPRATVTPGGRGGTQSADRGARNWPLPSDPPARKKHQGKAEQHLTARSGPKCGTRASRACNAKVRKASVGKRSRGPHSQTCTQVRLAPAEATPKEAAAPAPDSAGRLRWPRHRRAARRQEAALAADRGHAMKRHADRADEEVAGFDRRRAGVAAPIDEPGQEGLPGPPF